MVQTSSSTATLDAPAGSQPQSVGQDFSAQLPALDYDIAIVGGGIVGLTLACALKQSGLRIALIEARPRAAGLQHRRAYALTLLTGRIFSGLGIWQAILPRIATFQQIRLADADYPEVIHLQPCDLDHAAPELGYVGEHFVLLEALYSALEDAPNLTWLCPAEVVRADYDRDRTELIVRIQGAEKTLKTSLLVAADGARSPVRQQAGIDTQGWKYWQSCVTAVIRPEHSHQNVAREHFWPSGPFASLPLPDNRYQIVLTAPHDEAKALLEMDEQHFLAELNRRYEGQLGQLELLGDRLMFPVQLMHSRCYVQPRLALIGDAAHSCHPVGGQGLNMGIRDAAALAQVLEAAHRRGEDVGSARVLRRYERWRRLENWLILGFTDLLDRVFSNRWPPVVVVRRLGLWTMRRVRLLKFLALRLMTGLTGRSPKLGRHPTHPRSP